MRTVRMSAAADDAAPLPDGRGVGEVCRSVVTLEKGGAGGRDFVLGPALEARGVFFAFLLPAAVATTVSEPPPTGTTLPLASLALLMARAMSSCSMTAAAALLDLGSDCHDRHDHRDVPPPLLQQK